MVVFKTSNLYKLDLPPKVINHLLVIFNGPLFQCVISFDSGGNKPKPFDVFCSITGQRRHRSLFIRQIDLRSVSGQLKRNTKLLGEVIAVTSKEWIRNAVTIEEQVCIMHL